MTWLVWYLIGGVCGFALCALFAASAVKSAEGEVERIRAELEERSAWP